MKSRRKKSNGKFQYGWAWAVFFVQTEQQPAQKNRTTSSNSTEHRHSYIHLDTHTQTSRLIIINIIIYYRHCKRSTKWKVRRVTQQLHTQHNTFTQQQHTKPVWYEVVLVLRVLFPYFCWCAYILRRCVDEWMNEGGFDSVQAIGVCWC